MYHSDCSQATAAQRPVYGPHPVPQGEQEGWFNPRAWRDRRQLPPRCGTFARIPDPLFRAIQRIRHRIHGVGTEVLLYIAREIWRTADQVPAWRGSIRNLTSEMGRGAHGHVGRVVKRLIEWGVLWRKEVARKKWIYGIRDLCEWRVPGVDPVGDHWIPRGVLAGVAGQILTFPPLSDGELGEHAARLDYEAEEGWREWEEEEEPDPAPVESAPQPAPEPVHRYPSVPRAEEDWLWRCRVGWGRPRGRRVVCALPSYAAAVIQTSPPKMGLKIAGWVDRLCLVMALGRTHVDRLSAERAVLLAAREPHRALAEAKRAYLLPPETCLPEVDTYARLYQNNIEVGSQTQIPYLSTTHPLAFEVRLDLPLLIWRLMAADPIYAPFTEGDALGHLPDTALCSLIATVEDYCWKGGTRLPGEGAYRLALKGLRRHPRWREVPMHAAPEYPVTHPWHARCSMPPWLDPWVRVEQELSQGAELREALIRLWGSSPVKAGQTWSEIAQRAQGHRDQGAQ